MVKVSGTFHMKRFGFFYWFYKAEYINILSNKFLQIGIRDLPAMLDYILSQTQYEKLHYIGHSQGTTTFFVMASQVPAYNDKILSMQALAPVAFLSHLKSPLVRAASYLPLNVRPNLEDQGFFGFKKIIFSFP